MSKLISILAALALSTGSALADAYSGGICLAPTEFHIGEVGSNQILITSSPTVTSGSTYPAGSSIGGLLTLANVARVNAAAGSSGTSGLIQTVVMTTKSHNPSPGIGFDVVFFDSNPSTTTCTDHSAVTIAAADIGKVVGVSHLIDATQGGAAVDIWQDLTMRTMPYSLNNATSIFACVITRATPGYSSTSDVTFKFQVIRQ